MANNPKHKENLTPFKKWQSGNPNGRPPKLVSSFNKELEEAGYPPIKQDQIIMAYMQIMNLDSDKLNELHNMAKKGDNMPFLYKLLLKNLNSNRWLEALEKMLDRAIWKAVQKNEDRIVDGEWNDLFKKLNIHINGTPNNTSVLE